MSDALSQERLELIEQIAGMSEAAQAMARVPAAKAALFLGYSTSQLANMRNKGEPPPPAPHAEGGKQGSDVMYLARTLVEYVKGMPISQIGAGASVVVEKDTLHGKLKVINNSIAGSRVTRHRMKWAATVDPAIAEDAEFPFFVNEQGLVLGPAWQSVQQTFDWFMAPETDVTFQTWVRGLAMVWVSESDRVAAINDCARDVPEVPDLVTQFRKQQLAAI